MDVGKLTGLDKQLSKSLDMEVQTDAPVAELATSPVGPLSEPSRYVYMICSDGALACITSCASIFGCQGCCCWEGWRVVAHALPAASVRTCCHVPQKGRPSNQPIQHALLPHAVGRRWCTSYSLSTSATRTTTSRSCEHATSARRRAPLTSRALWTATSSPYPRCGHAPMQSCSKCHVQQATGRASPSPVQVWEQNPRYGGSKFLDGLWSAIDEVCPPAWPAAALL